MNRNINPIFKYAGGKRQLLPEIKKLLPKCYNKYIEPFVGGGAVYFLLNREKSIISDTNDELINAYKCLSKDSNQIIKLLENYKNDKDYFYQIRSKKYEDPFQKAARIIYLNRTCFNGLFRVNKKGEFNVPFGNYKNPKFIDLENLALAIPLLKKTKIYNQDYKKILDKFADTNDLVFLDPPYMPISKYSDFKRYTKDQFYEKDHIILKSYMDKLTKKGCYVIQTNSNSEIINNLYKNYKIKIVETKRNINSQANKRSGQDILITNF